MLFISFRFSTFTCISDIWYHNHECIEKICVYIISYWEIKHFRLTSSIIKSFILKFTFLVEFSVFVSTNYVIVKNVPWNESVGITWKSLRNCKSLTPTADNWLIICSLSRFPRLSIFKLTPENQNQISFIT